MRNKAILVLSLILLMTGISLAISTTNTSDNTDNDLNMESESVTPDTEPEEIDDNTEPNEPKSSSITPCYNIQPVNVWLRSDTARLIVRIDIGGLPSYYIQTIIGYLRFRSTFETTTILEDSPVPIQKDFHEADIINNYGSFLYIIKDIPLTGNNGYMYWNYEALFVIFDTLPEELFRF